ncbi:MAG: sulfotransferase domain-containing protein [Actinomycetota bacterium]
MSEPNLFLVGAPKAGTTSVAELLGSHKDVFLGYPKEPCFLSSDLGSRPSSVVLNSMSDYLRIYVGGTSHRYRLDASTTYLRSSVAVERAMELSPDAAFIVCLRNPVDLLVAFHQEMIFNLNEDEPDVGRAVDLWRSRRNGRDLPSRCTDPQHLDYLSIASLATQLESVMNFVPSDRLLLLRFELIGQEPDVVEQHLVDFLGLSTGFDKSLGHRKSRRSHRFGPIAVAIQDPPAALEPAVRVTKRLVRRNPLIRKATTSVLTRPTALTSPSPDVRRRLLELLRPEIERLEMLTGWDLSDWSADA